MGKIVFRCTLVLLAGIYWGNAQDVSEQKAKEGMCTMFSSQIAHVIKIFHDQKLPKNVSLGQTGFLQNSPEWKLANSAYDLYEKGTSREDVQKKLYGLCEGFNINSLTNNPDNTNDFICEDLAVSLYAMIVENTWAKADILFEFKYNGGGSGPELEALVDFAFELKRRTIDQTEYQKAIHAHCEKGGPQKKSLLSKQYYPK